ncbi:MAG TPA: PhzF family phenazine biosynthesis protein [Actinomycetales bacterium]|nr:PhzF family phenazine biosynthesis protein [Actinomycetales bacterium]
MSRLSFEVLDVFTDRPFAGNPLAVVTGGEDLSTEQMQALAREFHLSETCFPLEPTPEERARGVDYRLRIFTPTTELPFAGHPSVGAAWLMAQRGRVEPGRVVQACGAGDLPLLVAPDGGPVTLTGGSPTLGARVDGAQAAAAVGLGLHDLAGPEVQLAGTGVEFVILHVTEGAVPRARAVSIDDLGQSVYVVAWPGTDAWPLPADAAPGDAAGDEGDAVTDSVTDAPDHGSRLREPVRARLFAGDIGVAEDPATGSAALALAVQAVAAGLLPADGTSSFEILQGVELGRPSTLLVEVDAEGGRAVQARVSGSVVPVSSGTITVPPPS